MSEKKRARVNPPGFLIGLELEERGWSQKDFAEILGMSEQFVSGLIKGERTLTIEVASIIGKAFGTSPEAWMNLEAKFRLFLKQSEEEQADRVLEETTEMRAEAYSRMPVRELRKRGLISKKNRKNGGLVSGLLSALGLESLDCIPQAAPMCLRASNAWTPSERGLAAWFLLARKNAAAQEVGAFSRKQLSESLPSLFQASVNVEKIPEVPAWLAKNGIAFVYLPHFEKTYLDGATFQQEGKPVLGLTLRHDRLDNFWFTLAHELGHIALGHEEEYFDTTEGPERRMGPKEKEADEFAREHMVPSAEFEAFKKRCRTSFPPEAIVEFSRTIQRHPALVVGRLRHDGHVPWGSHGTLVPKVRELLKGK